MALETDAAVSGLENGRLDVLLDNVGVASVRVKDDPERFEIAFVNAREVFVGNAVKEGNTELAQVYFDGLGRYRRTERSRKSSANTAWTRS